MEVSPRARLAWANRNLEAAADIIVADWLRKVAPTLDGDALDRTDLLGEARLLDPKGATE